jgi:hypothetical protein
LVEIDLNITYSKAQAEIFFPENIEPSKYTIVTKGRRVGLTKGAAFAYIEYAMDGITPMLWGDTINANIDRYYERYFLPVLRQLRPSDYCWHQQRRELKILDSVIDFRSADRPENWEGFGYKKIFLNEAGIILKDDYLYDNAVLPMLTDFADSQLIAAGVPKGKYNKAGDHKFYTLFQKALNKDKNYRLLRYTSYDNPFIPKDQIDELASQLDDLNKDQEIYGEFVNANDKPFLYSFKESKHVVDPIEVNPNLDLWVSMDFNVEPMTCGLAQRYTTNTLKIVDEFSINNSDPEEVCKAIIAKYPHMVGRIKVTGDASGNNRTAIKRGVTCWKEVRTHLMLRDDDMKVRTRNLFIKDSRTLCNSVLQNADIQIGRNCKNVIKDCGKASVDEHGELIKDSLSHGNHHLDWFRYLIDSNFPDFIDNPRKYRQS